MSSGASSARYGWLLGLFAAVGIVFLVLGDVGFKTPPDPDAGGPDAAPRTGRRARVDAPDLHIVVMDATPGPDAAWPEESLNEDRVRRIGLLDREARWVDEVMNEPGHTWRRVADRGGPTWHDERLGSTVTFKVEDGRVRSIRADFAETALSASATSLSWIVLGNRTPLPFHLEDHQPSDALLQGTETLWDGRVLHWRAQLRRGGPPPYGPAWFEVGYRPFSAP